eukprot:3097417-Pyramimonas_sp.AAC.1
MAGSGSIQWRAVDRSNCGQWIDPMASSGWIQWHAVDGSNGGKERHMRLQWRPVVAGDLRLET